MKAKFKPEEVLKKLWEIFGKLKLPDRITTRCDYDDQEREQIEKHFNGMDRNNMTQYDVSMMLIDGALIQPESYLYYLPRLANDVLYADADAHFLNSKIDDLVNIADITSEQKGVLYQLRDVLTNLELHLDD